LLVQISSSSRFRPSSWDSGPGSRRRHDSTPGLRGGRRVNAAAYGSCDQPMKRSRSSARGRRH
jgi:hypothetical protein